jgi:hypothetical protein
MTIDIIWAQGFYFYVGGEIGPCTTSLFWAYLDAGKEEQLS